DASEKLQTYLEKKKEQKEAALKRELRRPKAEESPILVQMQREVEERPAHSRECSKKKLGKPLPAPVADLTGVFLPGDTGSPRPGNNNNHTGKPYPGMLLKRLATARLEEYTRKISATPIDFVKNKKLHQIPRPRLEPRETDPHLRMSLPPPVSPDATFEASAGRPSQSGLGSSFSPRKNNKLEKDALRMSPTARSMSSEVYKKNVDFYEQMLTEMLFAKGSTPPARARHSPSRSAPSAMESDAGIGCGRVMTSDDDPMRVPGKKLWEAEEINVEQTAHVQDMRLLFFGETEPAQYSHIRRTRSVEPPPSGSKADSDGAKRRGKKSISASASEVTEAIESRESVLLQLKQEVLCVDSDPTYRVESLMACWKTLLKHTLLAVEAICEWQALCAPSPGLSAGNYVPFTYQGHDYLLTIRSDLQFMNSSSRVREWLGIGNLEPPLSASSGAWAWTKPNVMLLTPGAANPSDQHHRMREAITAANKALTHARISAHSMRDAEPGRTPSPMRNLGVGTARKDETMRPGTDRSHGSNKPGRLSPSKTRKMSSMADQQQTCFDEGRAVRNSVALPPLSSSPVEKQKHSIAHRHVGNWYYHDAEQRGDT
ncbi:hypothetical protein CYMTET_20317, partial [Cymbomonas tetramitiformis]